MAVSTLEVIITGDSTGLTTALNRGAASTRGFQAQVTNTSSVSQKALGSVIPLGAAAAGLAIAAFAKSSVDAAIAFDRSFTQIAALTNTTADQIGVMKDAVMELSGETAVAPTELANSLYFLASSGLDAAQQMETLEATAKASASQLGNAGDLARITANALNVFSDNGLKAADVMDTIAAAVREGSAEPDEFADALGRVLPIADKAGISFQQVAASLATMSNAGLDVNEGVTALRGVLQSLVAPTQKTQDTLSDLGLSVDDVVGSLQQNGLIDTLRMLDKVARQNTNSTGEYNLVMRDLVPNVRALTGVFNLTTQEAEKVDQIFAEVTNSTGDLGDAFAKTAESDSFRMRKAMNELALAGQEVAADVLPAIADALSFIAPVLAKVLPLAVKLGEVWLGYKIVVAVAGWIRGLMGAQASGAIVAAEYAAAETAAASSLTLYVANAQGAVVATREVAAAQVSGAATASTFGSRLMGSGVVSFAAFTAAAILGQKAIEDVNEYLNSTHAPAEQFAQDMLNSTNSLFEMRQAAAQAASANEITIGEQITFAGAGVFGKFLADNFSSAAMGQKAFDEAANQVTETIRSQNQEILAGTNLYDIFEGAINSTANTNQDLHGKLAQVLLDYRMTAGGIDGLNIKAVKAAALSGDLAGAIDIVSRALDRQNQELQKDIGAEDRTNDLAKAFLAAEPIIRATDMSMSEFQATAEEALQSGEWDKFADTIRTDFTDAWESFHDAAFDALNFLPGALNDLTSAAQSASDELAGMTKDSDIGAGALAQLRDDANVTGEEILSAFQTAADESREFGKDLLSLSRVGGGAGEALAASLLESGDVMAAQIIANQPKQMQEQIVTAFNDGQTAADELSTRLTDAIVGPLESIEGILRRIAKTWGINVSANTEGARERIGNMEEALDRMTEKEYIVYVHTQPKSPWPDEALYEHLFKPMKMGGFTKGGDGWALPLNVGVHSQADVGPIDRELEKLRATIAKFIESIRGMTQVVKSALGQMDSQIMGSAESFDSLSKHATSAAKDVGDAWKQTAKDIGAAQADLQTRAEKLAAQQQLALSLMGKLGNTGFGSAQNETRRSFAEDLHAQLMDAGNIIGPRIADEIGNVRQALFNVMQSSQSQIDLAREEVGGKTNAILQQIKDHARRTGELDLGRLTAILRSTDMTHREIAEWHREARSGFNEGLEERRTRDWITPALKRLPRLPEGHTRIDRNRPHRETKMVVQLDREHFDRQLAYLEAYRGF